MKKHKALIIIVFILIFISAHNAKAEEYNRTIDYRYNLRGYKDYYFNSDYTDWYTERETTFTDRNTDNFIFTRETGSTTKAVTTTSVINGQDGTFYWSSSVVSGWSGSPPYLGHLYVDYIYTSPTSTVDTNYTISFTGEKHGTTTDATYYNRGTFTVELLGISRLDVTSYSTIKTISYVNNPDSEDEYNYGETVTITGDDGYNYSGYVLRVHVYCVSTPYTYPCNGNTYKIYTLTNSLDNFTPEVNYTEQLNNINGSLQSIYQAITNIPTTIVSAIADIGNTLKQLFVYDDWQDDIEDVASVIKIPYMQQITQTFANVMEQFEWYQPEHVIQLKAKNPFANYAGSGQEYIINTTYDLDTIGNKTIIENKTIKDLIHIAVKYGSIIYIVSAISNLLSIFGLDFVNYINPIIKKIGGFDK